MESKFPKMFPVFEGIASEALAEISLYCDEETCDRSERVIKES